MLRKMVNDKGIQTALVGLVVAVALYLGVDIPHNEITQAITQGDTSHVLTLVLGALIGILGGYRAKVAMQQPQEGTPHIAGEGIEKEAKDSGSK